MKKLEDYTPSQLAILATAVGGIIAAKLTTSQQNVIGNFLTGAAQSILIIAAQAQNLQAQQQNQSGDNVNGKLYSSNKDLQKQIDELKEYIKKFK